LAKPGRKHAGNTSRDLRRKLKKCPDMVGLLLIMPKLQ
jgi:hypothetical protein